MTITLDPEMEDSLREKAQREGRDPDAVAKMLLKDVLQAEARKYEESIAALQQALASERGKPMEQYLAEQRQKHGHSDTWPKQDVVKEIAPGVFVDNT